MTLPTDDKFQQSKLLPGPGLVDEVRSLLGPEYPVVSPSIGLRSETIAVRGNLAGGEELLADLRCRGPFGLLSL